MKQTQGKANPAMVSKSNKETVKHKLICLYSLWFNFI